MANNFLDKTGLSYFWEKVKSWANNRFYHKTGGSLDGDIRFVKKEGQVARSISFGNSGADGASLTFSENGIQFSGPDGADLNMSGRKIENVGDPSLDGDAVNYKLLKDRTASAPQTSDIGKVLTVSEWNDAPYLMWETIPTELPEGGTEGQVLSKTTDGVQWGDLPNSLVLASLQAKFPEVKTWKHLAYGNGRYVATPNSGNSYAYSDDLINWTIGTLPYSVSGSIVYGEGTSGGVFVICQTYGDNRKPIIYSFDGIEWNDCNISIVFSPFTVAFGNGVFVAISASENMSGSSVVKSEDGITWTAVSSPGLSNDYWSRINFCNDRFIAISYSVGTAGNRVAYSLDGLTWQESTMPNSSMRTNATYGNGKYVILERHDGNLSSYSYTSEDGATWSSTSLGSTFDVDWSSLAFGNGRFVAVEKDGSRAIYSTDGTAWTVTELPKTDSWEKVIWDGSKFVAIAYSSDSIAISIDGITWTSDIEKQVQDSSGIDVTEDVATAIFPEGGSAGQVLKKTDDGVTWSDIPEPEDFISVEGGGTAQMAASLGQGPFTIEFTEETEEIGQFLLTFGAQSVAASAWAADTTYDDYGFRAAIALANVTADYIPSVTFGIADATSGNLAPVADSYAGGVYIYAKEQPTAAVSIASVVCCKGV